MADDLNARLRATSRAYEDREAGAQPDDLELASLYRDVRRHRTGRTVRHAGVAAAALLVVGTAGWFGVRAVPDVPPAQTPTPTPTVAPAPSTAAPSPTPTPEPVRTPVEITGMPAMWALDDDVLAAAGPGWTLATYSPESIDSTAPGQVVLAAPDGRLFHVAAAPDEGTWSIVAWDGGATAVVHGSDGRAALDLRTGTLTPDPRGLPPGSRLTGHDAGHELWLAMGDGSPWVVGPDTAAQRVPGPNWDVLGSTDVSPDGTRALLTSGEGRPVVVDLTTGAGRDLGLDGLGCRLLGWADALTVALLCTDPTDLGAESFFPPMLADPALHPRYVQVRADGTGTPEVREIGSGELVPFVVQPLGAGKVAVAGAPLGGEVIDCATTAEVHAGDLVSRLSTPAPDLPWVAVPSVHGDVVHVMRLAGCHAERGDTVELVVVDTGTGTRTVLPAGPAGDRAMVPNGAAVTLTR